MTLHNHTRRKLRFETLESRKMLAATTIEVLLAGTTGTETAQLQIDNVPVATWTNVGGDANAGTFATFSYTHPTDVEIGQVRVDFLNDGVEGGVDKDLRVDGVIIEGQKFETEAWNVWSTGSWDGTGCNPGHQRSEFLNCNGYFQFGTFGSIIEVRAAGETGNEDLRLRIDGNVVASFDDIGGDYFAAGYNSFFYQHSEAVSVSQIHVELVDGDIDQFGNDLNARIDGIRLDGNFFESEASDVFSTGSFVEGIGCQPGVWQSEFLQCGGFLQFGTSLNQGTLGLGGSLFSFDEAAGTAFIPVVRTGGSEGTVALQYSTENRTATAGGDYVATSGLAILYPGQTSTTIEVPLINDVQDEENEFFAITAIATRGEASLGEPRTATVTILDDDGGPSIGTGNGLLGSYYNNTNFTALVFQRTDATVNYDWGSGSPGPGIGSDTFSVRWEGEIQPLYSEDYTFRVATDDGTRLWINGQQIINEWRDQRTVFDSAPISLQAGQRYDVRLEMYDNQGQALQNLQWSSASQPREIVPQSQLYSDEPDPSETGFFSSQTVITGLTDPTALDFDDSGKMFIALQEGVVRVAQNNTLLPTPFLDFSSRVNNIQDRGLIGIALHPNFPQTPYVYLSYTYDPPETLTRSGLAGPDGGGNRVARLTRVTADASNGFNTVVPGSETVLLGTNSTWDNINRPDVDGTINLGVGHSCGSNGTLDDCLPADSRSHTIGNIAFGLDGSLYVTNGDGTSFNQVDGRTRRVQDLNSLAGKLIRIDPITGAGLPDNPFFNGDPNANVSKVVNLGYRNPFRLAIHPVTGIPYVGDVGWTAWEEINAGFGENFGWPWYEGGDGVNLRTGGYENISGASEFYANNNAVPPILGRTHSSGGIAMVVGDFYTGDVYPSRFQNQLFYTDYGEPTFRSLEIFADGSVQRSNLGAQMPGAVEMSLAPDGLIYYADNRNGTIGRMQFTPTNQAAAAQAATGDFNFDGSIEGSDFLEFQTIAGQSNVGVGDLGEDAVVGDDELLTFASNYGSENVAIGVAAIQSETPVDSSASEGDEFASELFWLAYEEPKEAEGELVPAMPSLGDYQLPAADASNDLPLAFGVNCEFDAPVANQEEVVDDAFDDWSSLPSEWIGRLV
ncbi:MAG: PQQ-dependent sugar dehydrogenase [Lacipirellulaceae bacterium]